MRSVSFVTKIIKHCLVINLQVIDLNSTTTEILWKKQIDSLVATDLTENADTAAEVEESAGDIEIGEIATPEVTFFVGGKEEGSSIALAGEEEEEAILEDTKVCNN